MKEMKGLIVFDCDSTLSEIEGIDELAGIKGVGVKQQVEDLTNKAMAGELAISEVFGKRMEIIKPTESEAKAIGEMYIKAVEPTALETINTLKAKGCLPVILSGGFAPVIEPLAKYLKIDTIEAVPLFFDSNGKYAGYGENYPTTRNSGKAEIIEELKKRYNPSFTVMIGDGISDLETKPAVDLFIGFGKYAVRKKVEEEADLFVDSLAHIIEPICKQLAESSV